MTENTVFIVAGGDERQIYAAIKLAEKYNVYIFGLENSDADTGKAKKIENINEIIKKADCLILPLPVSQEGIFLNTPLSDRKITLSSLSKALNPRGIILGGRFTPSAQELLTPFETIDYSQREVFSVLNAVPTAEAAIKIALENSRKCLYKSKILITGFGRISKALIKSLNGLGAEITVAARKKADLCWSEFAGCNTVNIKNMESESTDYDFIFNTVPAPVIDEKIIKRLKPEALIIDLASKPGGVDFECAKQRGIRTIHALSLPGIHFPETAGEIIAATVLQIMKERSINI